MKKYILLFVYYLGISLFFTSCTSDNNNASIDSGISLEAEIRLEVSYGNDPQQVFDLYLPANRSSAKTKVVILVHGGGWTGGDKDNMTDLVHLIQENHPDHAIVNLNYVLASTTTPAFPNQFLDLKSVINKLTSEKDELQLLPEFGLIGSSAGAHISLMYDYVYDIGDQVKFVGDIVGPTDFSDVFYANNVNFSILLNLLIDENAYPDGTNFAEATSPAFQVSSTSSPSILFYGDQDPLVPLSNGQLLATKLSNAQVTNSLTIYSGGHGNWDAASLTNLQLQLSSFINAHLPI